MYFMLQSCLYIVINFLQPPKPNQNMLYLSTYHWPVQNSSKFYKNINSVERAAPQRPIVFGVGLPKA